MVLVVLAAIGSGVVLIARVAMRPPASHDLDRYERARDALARAAGAGPPPAR